MGLFGKKDICSVCGGKLPALGKTRLSDGAICKNCREQCTQYLSMPQIRHVEDIRRNMEDCSDNKSLYNQFRPQSFGCGLHADFTNKLWCVASGSEIKKKQAYIFRFSDILDYEFVEDGNTVTKSGAGSAIAGGLLFGGVGLLAGGLVGKRSKETINKMSIFLKVNSEWVNKIELPIVTSEIKKGGMTYQLSKTAFEKMVETIDAMQLQA